MKNLKYIFMVLLGGTMYGTMSSFVKLSYTKGFNAAEISFWQAFIAALLLAIYAFFTRKNIKGKLTFGNFIFLLFTGSAIGLTNFFYYESVSYISASLAIVILMQFTWFSLLLEWLIFKSKPSKPELITVSFILVGTIMAGNILGAKAWEFSMKGVLFALSSSLTYTVYIIANSRVSKSVRWQTKSMVIMMGSSLCLFSINSEIILSSDYLNDKFFCWAIFLAVVGTTVPTALFGLRLQRLVSVSVLLLMTVELPVAIICARIVLKEQIGSLQIVGIVIMLASICIMNYYKVYKSKR